MFKAKLAEAFGEEAEAAPFWSNHQGAPGAGVG